MTGLWAGQGSAKYAMDHESTEVLNEQVDRISSKIFEPLEKKVGLTFQQAHKTLSDMLLRLGFVPIDTARANELLASVRAFLTNDQHRIVAEDPHYLGKVLSLKNAAAVFEVVAQYMLHRKESRGSLINEDYPYTDNINWLTRTRSRLDETGRVHIWDESIPEDNFALWIPARKKILHPAFKALKFGNRAYA